MLDDGENESLEDDVRSFVDKMSHLTTAVSRRGVAPVSGCTGGGCKVDSNSLIHERCHAQLFTSRKRKPSSTSYRASS